MVVTCPRICRRPGLGLHLRNRGQRRKRITNRMRTYFRPCHASVWRFRLNIQSTALGARYSWPRHRPVQPIRPLRRQPLPGPRRRRLTLAEIIDDQRGDLRPAPARVAPAGRRCHRRARRRRHLQLADHPAAAGVAQPWARAPGCTTWTATSTSTCTAAMVSSLAGHGHPAIVEAVRSQVDRGTHFAQPTATALAVRGALPPVRAAAVADRQLRHRGHHGRRAPHARDHRP